MKSFAFAGVALALLALAPSGAALADAPQPLTLAQAVAIAADKSPSVALANLRTQEAAAKVGQSRGALLPTVTGQASMVDRTFNLYTLGITLPTIPGLPPYAKLQGPVYDSEARLQVAQPLFDLASWRRMRASQLGVQGARADQGVSAEGAAQSAAIAYLRAARAQALVTARTEDLGLAQQLDSLAEAQLAAGTSPQIDVTRARTQLATTRGELVIARNARDRARIDLARALGLDPNTPLALVDTLSASLGTSESPGETAAAVAFALEHRPELRGEQARLARARADRAATADERLPRVGVSADWGQSGQHYADAIPTYTYALGVTVPLVDGFRREGKLAEEGALVRESEVREHDLRDQIAAEVNGALLDLATGQEQETIVRERLQLALEEVSQATDRFTSGVAGNIEVIDAQSSLVQARDADIDARFAVASARVALARAAGVARNVH
ncbi:MAG TPA: TolC family protein [Candidatus Acidoferrales bacterium]|nr:TolC family protein [Candidatus Acidoferrales bacterium]